MVFFPLPPPHPTEINDNVMTAYATDHKPLCFINLPPVPARIVLQDARGRRRCRRLRASARAVLEDDRRVDRAARDGAPEGRLAADESHRGGILPVHPHVPFGTIAVVDR